MQIDDQNKIQVLLRLLEQNAKSIEWVKEFDFKIAYQTLFLYAAIVAFAATKDTSSQVRCLLFVTVLFVALGAVTFLLRNHGRHLGLVKEDAQIRKALLLTESKIYHDEPIFQVTGPDFFFHLGRILYVLFVMVGATLVGSLVWLVGQ